MRRRPKLVLLAFLGAIVVGGSPAPMAIALGVAGAAPPTVVDQASGWLGALTVRHGILYAGEGPRLVAYEVATWQAEGPPRRLGASEMLPGSVVAMTLAGDLAYVVVSGVGLWILDIADPGSIRVRGSLRIAGVHASDPIVRDGTAYLAACARGLSVVDVRDASLPVEVTNVPLQVPGFADHVTCTTVLAAGPDLAYAFYDDNTRWTGSRLAVLSLVDPQRPVIVGQPDYDALRSRQTRVVAVSGGHLLGIFQNDLVIFELSDPTKPQVVAQPMPDPYYWANGLVIDGNRAFVNTDYVGSEGRSGMAILDISDPLKPQELSFVPMMGRLSQPAVADGFAYVIEYDRRPDWATGLHAVDISDPGTPRPVAYVQMPGRTASVAATAGTAFAISSTGRLWSYGLAPDSRLGTPSLVDVPWQADGAAVSGSLLVAAAGSDGLRVLDAADPRRITEVAALVPDPTSRQQYWSVVMNGETAYVLGGEPNTRFADGTWSLTVVDMHEPRSPRAVATLALPKDTSDLAVRDGRVVVVGKNGIEIIDVTDPAQPVVVGQMVIGRAATHVALGADGTAFVTAVNSLRVIDLADPRRPAQLADLPLPGAAFGDQYGLAMADNYVFVAANLAATTDEGWSQLLLAFDARDPRHVAEVARLGLPGQAGPPRLAAPSPDTILVAAGSCGLLSLKWQLPGGGVVFLPWVGRDQVAEIAWTGFARRVRGGDGTGLPQ